MVGHRERGGDGREHGLLDQVVREVVHLTGGRHQPGPDQLLADEDDLDLGPRDESGQQQGLDAGAEHRGRGHDPARLVVQQVELRGHGACDVLGDAEVSGRQRLETRHHTERVTEAARLHLVGPRTEPGGAGQGAHRRCGQGAEHDGLTQVRHVWKRGQAFGPDGHHDQDR